MADVEVVICDRCKGWGKISESVPVLSYYGTPIGFKRTNRDCPDCNGTGRWIKRTKVEYKNFEESVDE